MTEITKTSKKVYECSFLELYEDQVILSNNKESQRVFIKHAGASAILPFTTSGDVILTKQFRYPIKQISLEVPAGKKDELNEDSLLCAKRELEEETGYNSTNITFLNRIFPCVGYSNEYIDLFIAKNCYKVKKPLQKDEDENIEVVIVTIKKVQELIGNNEIKDAKTLILLQAYFLGLTHKNSRGKDEKNKIR